ncbi:hypothetical protein H4W80_012088 [Nonomuraea angiospora]|uniref:Uncharacterized protein n=1 Tax=Nonomuraea angiospora TaxID=46172 RepID=A0ABR9MMN0_9ACTN|nr:hypothetical protein [Nonomuraea angiospora]
MRDETYRLALSYRKARGTPDLGSAAPGSRGGGRPDLVGQQPLRYLAEWRMTIAAGGFPFERLRGMPPSAALGRSATDFRADFHVPQWRKRQRLRALQ